MAAAAPPSPPLAEAGPPVAPPHPPRNGEGTGSPGPVRSQPPPPLPFSRPPSRRGPCHRGWGWLPGEAPPPPIAPPRCGIAIAIAIAIAPVPSSAILSALALIAAPTSRLES